jgi:hypothetical protein
MRFFDSGFIINGMLGKFCTAIPDNRTEYKFNHLKLNRKNFGT